MKIKNITIIILVLSNTLNLNGMQRCRNIFDTMRNYPSTYHDLPDLLRRHRDTPAIGMAMEPFKHAVNDFFTTGAIDDSPLCLAVTYNKEYAVESLIRYGAQVNLQNAEGRGAIHAWALSLALNNGKLGFPLFRTRATIDKKNRILKSLLYAGLNINATTAWRGTALHLAALSNPPAVPHLIVMGAKIDARDGHGFTALHANIKWSPTTDGARHLLEHGANTQIEDYDGLRPIDLALQNNRLAHVALLQSHTPLARR